jgi:hypothetical protein
MNDDDSCPICFEEYSREKFILKDGNLNHEIESKCKHWFCIQCLAKMFENKIFNCPICRENIRQLVYIHCSRNCNCRCYSSEEESKNSEDSSEEDNNEIERLYNNRVIEDNNENSDNDNNSE